MPLPYGLFQVIELADSEDDGIRVCTPKFIDQQMNATEDVEKPTTSKPIPTSSAPAMHQPRTQQKLQQQPQKRPQQQQQPSQSTQDAASSQVSAMAQNFLPYVYAAGGLPQAYYASLASMYSGFPGMSIV